MLVVSSPSGAGKTTLTRRLIEADPEVALSISVTTRPRRASEIDGRDYHFIPVGEFERMRDAGELLEWADVFGHFYGTPRGPVLAAIEAGRDVLFDIDWQGAAQLRQRMPAEFVGVFILPPSGAELARRLHTRAEDSEEVIRMRLAGAAREIGHWGEYDYVIVNEDLEAAFARLNAILLAERQRVSRRPAVAGHVDGLRADLESRLAR